MTNKETIKKWEDMGFLEGLVKNQKLPISLALEKFFLFIKDLDDNKRFNHGDLQELSDLGIAMIVECLKENLDHQIDTDNIFKMFFNTNIKQFDENVLTSEYGDLPLYLFIRYHIVPDEGVAINTKHGFNIEEILRDLMIEYYTKKYIQK